MYFFDHSWNFCITSCAYWFALWAPWINNGNWTEYSALWSEIIQVISKLNKHAAWVWFEITSIISDQNFLTQIYYHHFIMSIVNSKIQLLKYRIFVVVELKYFIDLVLSWFIKLKNCVSFSSNLIGLCEQTLKCDWLLCFNRGF